MNDEQALQALTARWGYARDCDDWTTLAACFHADARIHISWIDADAQTFVERSRTMAARRRPGAHMKHLMSPSWVERRRGRAFCRTHALLLIRDEHDGVWFDIESHIRFFDRAERRDGVWRFLDRTAVYDKDRLDRLDRLDGQPWGGRHPDGTPGVARELCWWLGTRGFAPVPGLIAAYSAEEIALRDACLSWLEGG